MTRRGEPFKISKTIRRDNCRQGHDLDNLRIVSPFHFACHPMSKSRLKAHFDGQHVVLDEPCELATGAPLMVTVLSENSDGELSHGNRLADASALRGYSPHVRGNRRVEATPRRSMALVIGFVYMLFVAQVITETTNWSYGVALGVSVTGCGIVMAALSALGVKAYRKKDARIRFTFSTVFLASIPLSVYLAAIRLVLNHAPVRTLPNWAWLVISLFSMMAMILSTAVLMSFAEALVWFAIACLPRKRSASPRGRGV